MPTGVDPRDSLPGASALIRACPSPQAFPTPQDNHFGASDTRARQPRKPPRRGWWPGRIDADRASPRDSLPAAPALNRACRPDRPTRRGWWPSVFPFGASGLAQPGFPRSGPGWPTPEASPARLVAFRLPFRRFRACPTRLPEERPGWPTRKPPRPLPRSTGLAQPRKPSANQGNPFGASMPAGLAYPGNLPEDRRGTRASTPTGQALEVGSPAAAGGTGASMPTGQTLGIGSPALPHSTRLAQPRKPSRRYVVNWKPAPSEGFPRRRRFDAGRGKPSG